MGGLQKKIKKVMRWRGGWGARHMPPPAPLCEILPLATSVKPQLLYYLQFYYL